MKRSRNLAGAAWAALLLVLFAAGAARAAGSGATAGGVAPAPQSAPAAQKVVFAGGCFWGMEAVFESLKGVTSAVSGYAGGSKDTAHYEIVSTGDTGHAESVEVTYDPAQISFQQLLAVFFLVAHDPTELNRQGPDEGTQYRSAIFFTDDAQKKTAAAYMLQLQRDKVFDKAIVTELVPLQAFFPAENYHQHFVARNPYYPYVVVNDLPKLAHLRKQFPQLVKPSS
jgi:peptide-methionine (S)-S-oxide reductase